MDLFLQLYGHSDTINIFVDPEQQRDAPPAPDPRRARPVSPKAVPPWKRRAVEVMFYFFKPSCLKKICVTMV